MRPISLVPRFLQRPTCSPGYRQILFLEFPVTFSLLVDYLYRDNVPDPPPQKDESNRRGYISRMLNLYYLAEKLRMNDLMNKTLTAIQVVQEKKTIEVEREEDI